MAEIKNVLIVEKRKDIIDKTIKTLKDNNFGYNFEKVSNISSALKLIDKKSFDLLISSYELPDGTASVFFPTTFQKFKFPVIVLFDFYDFQNINEALNSFASDCLVKDSNLYNNLPISVLRALKHHETFISKRKTEHNLWESEYKYRILTENINDVVWIIEENLERYKYVSPSIYDFLGYKPEEIISMPLKKITDKDSYLNILNKLSDIKHKMPEYRSKNMDNFDIITEVKFTHKDGGYKWAEIRGSVMFDQDNNIIGISGVTIDITDKKIVEQKLKIQETYFETLVNEAPVAIAIIDNHDKIQRLNKKFEKLFGYKQDKVKGMLINDLIVPKDLKKEGVESTLSVTQGQQVDFDTVRQNKNGEKIQVSVLGKPVFLKDDQLAIFAIYQDISERKNTEQKLRELSERLILATQSARIGIWDYDIKENKLIWEKEMFNLLGIDKECSDNLIEEFKRIIYNEDDHKILDNISKINDYVDSHYEDWFRIVDKIGKTRFIKVVASAFKNNDESIPSRIIGACWDITKEVEHGELENKVEIADKVANIKQQFIANMSHEIRSPLTGIIGMSGLLQNTKLNEKQKKYVDIVMSSSKSLLEIVNDILDLSKVEAGKMELNPVVFNIKESGTKIHKLFYALVKQKNIYFDIKYDDKLPNEIYADEYRLSQVITNLVSNAVKFTDKGGIKLSYTLMEEIGYSYRIKVTVEDSGIGISKENQGKLFDMFSQADASDTRVYEGTGLGLAICKEMVELMGGEIGLESDLGSGTKFWFTFMAKKVSEEGQYPEEFDNPEKFVKLPKPFNVLLVEDKKTNQLVLSLMLKEIGCKTELASNGEEALKKFAPGKYDFIFMDIQMPVMDGVTTVKELKRLYGKSALPVIIGLSAKAMEGDAEFYLAQGMDDYLTKPVSIAKIVERFKYWNSKIRNKRIFL